MRTFGILCASLFVVVLSLSASPVRAQNVLWVGPNGSDANACSRTSPCASFQGAINKGSVSQINCLGSGFYGTFTITGSITVDCGAGNVGNIVDAAHAGITINISSVATITLRHLALNGLANGNNTSGIDAGQFFSGTLIVEDCIIQGYAAGFGITFGAGSGRGLLQVSNSQIFKNVTGIVVSADTNQIASATLNKVELTSNSNDGVVLSGNVIAGTMRNSVVTANGNIGLVANASQVFFTVEESSIVDNLTTGIQTNSAGSVVNVGASTIGGNGTGIKNNAGQIISFGNNQMSANGTNGTFTSTVARQ